MGYCFMAWFLVEDKEDFALPLYQCGFGLNDCGILILTADPSGRAV
jgi:hypothetical protein